MAEYFCAWKDKKGVVWPTEKQAKDAEAKYEEERKREVRRQELILGFRSNIDYNGLPYFRSYREYGSGPSYRINEENRELLIQWVIRNEAMIKSVLNGTA